MCEKVKKIKNRVPVLTADEAVRMIPSGAVVYLDGTSTGIREPSALFQAVARRYRETGKPENLTLFFPNGVGDRQPDSDRGFSVLAVPGMVKRAIGGHIGQSPKIARMIDNNEIEGYNLSMGVMSQMMRAAAARTPGVISKVGLHTFQDPRQKGCKLNEKTTEDIVRVMEIDGEEYLFYKTIQPTVALLRGTTADEEGYVTMEDEVGASFLDEMAVAQAVHNNGGVVIVQVQRMTKTGCLNPKQVKIPGIYVDAVVVEPDQWQSYSLEGKPTDRHASCDFPTIPADMPPLPLTERKAICRRSLLEIRPGVVGNVGVGVQTALSAVAQEEGISDQFTLTTECGTVGGVAGPPEGSNFGIFRNMRAVIPMPDQFAFYDGGGLDVAFLSFAQLDQEGNVNVHRLAGKIMGTGGFVNISANSKKIVFGGTMTSGGLKVEIRDGKVHILKEGRFRKFVKQVDEITFSGKVAREQHKPVLYITERCVFRLTADGVELIEIAPGIDLETQILPLMDFMPQISPELKLMDPRIFRDQVMGVRADFE